MCDNVRWIKVNVGMYDDEKMKILDSMENSDGVNCLWVKLLIQAAKTNAKGRIFLSEDTPYTNEMLSVIFSRPIELVKFSLKVLSDLKMITVDERNFITIVNWEKHQNVEGMERIREQNRKRAEKFREKNKAQDALNSEADNEEKNSNVTVTEQNKRETENKNKKKNKKENKRDSDWGEEVLINNKKDEKENSIGKEDGLEKRISSEDDIMEYINHVSGKSNRIRSSAVKSAIAIHGVENVKLALDRALEVGKFRMNYINGILSNWMEEGYPNNCRNSNGSSDKYKAKGCRKLAFNNFEPRAYDYDTLEKELLGW